MSSDVNIYVAMRQRVYLLLVASSDLSRSLVVALLCPHGSSDDISFNPSQVRHDYSFVRLIMRPHMLTHQRKLNIQPVKVISDEKCNNAFILLGVLCILSMYIYICAKMIHYKMEIISKFHWSPVHKAFFANLSDCKQLLKQPQLIVY